VRSVSSSLRPDRSALFFLAGRESPDVSAELWRVLDLFEGEVHRCTLPSALDEELVDIGLRGAARVETGRCLDLGLRSEMG
jgi:hypothetical protein